MNDVLDILDFLQVLNELINLIVVLLGDLDLVDGNKNNLTRVSLESSALHRTFDCCKLVWGAKQSHFVASIVQNIFSTTSDGRICEFVLLCFFDSRKLDLSHLIESESKPSTSVSVSDAIS